jgi:hypothetical protein
MQHSQYFATLLPANSTTNVTGIVKRIFTKDEQYERDIAASRRKWTDLHAAALRLTGKSSEHP